MNEKTKMILDWVMAGYSTMEPELSVKNQQTIKIAVMAGTDFAQEREIEDMIAFIKWADKNGKSASWIAGQLMHDLTGIAMAEPCFMPRTVGYSDLMQKGA